MGNTCCRKEQGSLQPVKSVTKPLKRDPVQTTRAPSVRPQTVNPDEEKI